MPENYVIGDGFKLYKIFFFLTLSKKKAATCFGYLANDKKGTESSWGENFTIFIFHYALVFAMTGEFRVCFYDNKRPIKSCIKSHKICELLSCTHEAFALSFAQPNISLKKTFSLFIICDNHKQLEDTQKIVEILSTRGGST